MFIKKIPTNMFYLVKTPKFVKDLFPNFLWSVPTQEKVLYLTFDDGPIPVVTPWVLEQLAAFNAKATFFCVGQNAEKYPDIFERVKAEGHTVGNHTNTHANGWSSDNLPYFHDVRHGARITGSALFRPPYGKLRRGQALFLQRHYSIVMWDVLSADFDPEVSPQACLSNVVDNARQGSIVVFHDSVKAQENLRYALPRVLDHFASRGYRFEALQAPDENIITDDLVQLQTA